MTPADVYEVNIPDDGCNCQYNVDVLHARSALRQADAYHILTVMCGASLCFMVIAFFVFLMLAAWYERHTTVDTMIVGTVFGLFSTMVGVLFGVSKKRKLIDTVKALTKQEP